MRPKKVWTLMAVALLSLTFILGMAPGAFGGGQPPPPHPKDPVGPDITGVVTLTPAAGDMADAVFVGKCVGKELKMARKVALAKPFDKLTEADVTAYAKLYLVTPTPKEMPPKCKGNQGAKDLAVKSMSNFKITPTKITADTVLTFSTKK